MVEALAHADGSILVYDKVRPFPSRQTSTVLLQTGRFSERVE